MFGSFKPGGVNTALKNGNVLSWLNPGVVRIDSSGLPMYSMFNLKLYSRKYFMVQKNLKAGSLDDFFWGSKDPRAGSTSYPVVWKYSPEPWFHIQNLAVVPFLCPQT